LALLLDTTVTGSGDGAVNGAPTFLITTVNVPGPAEPLTGGAYPVMLHIGWWSALVDWRGSGSPFPNFVHGVRQRWIEFVHQHWPLAFDPGPMYMDSFHYELGPSVEVRFEFFDDT
jgi:hypothetical protein